MISKSTILRIYAIRMVAMVNNKPQSAQKMILTSEGSQRTVVDPQKNFDRNLVTELKYCVRECTISEIWLSRSRSANSEILEYRRERGAQYR